MKQYVISIALVLVVALCFVIYPKEATAEPSVFPAPVNKPEQIIMCLNSSNVFVDGLIMIIDPNDYQITPFESQNEVYIPLRFVAELLKTEIGWEGKTNSVTINNGAKQVEIPIGSNKITVNNQGVELSDSKPAVIKNGRVFITPQIFKLTFDKSYSQSNEYISLCKTATEQEYKALSEKLRGLPVIGTKDKLIELIGGMEQFYSIDYGFEYGYATSDSLQDPQASTGKAEAPNLNSSVAGETAAPESARDESKQMASDDFSKTNVQVMGVDEGDVIKTDGEYIYYLRGKKLSVVKAVPANEMKLMYTVNFNSQNFYPNEIYNDNKRLIVIGRDYKSSNYKGKDITTALVYDITDKSNVKQIREINSDGNYLSSRKIGNSVYLITNLWVSSLFWGDNNLDNPSFRDTAKGSEYSSIDYNKIYYCPGYSLQTYTMILRFDLDKETEPAKVTTYLSSGNNVYVSQDNMFIAESNYNAVPMPVQKGGMGFTDSVYNSNPSTTIYKFKLLKEGQYDAVSFIAKNDVEGTVLNQFSMDENNDYFRIATTGLNESGQQSNNLFVLDLNLKQVGKITNIAPGEKIYSVRYMGKRAYMVTFKQVDPLFAIDLSDPYNPKILGALKIPGYSDYLHPYDENHLIGFGKDTVLYKDTAFYQGMKMSLFNVADPTNPKELFVETIGDRGTDSELLSNHRALLFSKEKNLLAFPVTLFETSAAEKNNPTAYGQYKGQGAYIYSIDLNKGFVKRGVISHETSQSRLSSGYYEGDRSLYVDRIIYIGDNLYVTSMNMITANSLANLTQVGNVRLDN